MKCLAAARGIGLALALSGSTAGAQVRIHLPAWTEPVMLDSMRQEHTVDAKPDAVYAAIPKAFEKLGIPVGNTDEKAGIVGSERFDKNPRECPSTGWLEGKILETVTKLAK
jgi:hypothetical protein